MKPRFTSKISRASVVLMAVSASFTSAIFVPSAMLAIDPDARLSTERYTPVKAGKASTEIQQLTPESKNHSAPRAESAVAKSAATKPTAPNTQVVKQLSDEELKATVKEMTRIQNLASHYINTHLENLRWDAKLGDCVECYVSNAGSEDSSLSRSNEG